MSAQAALEPASKAGIIIKVSIERGCFTLRHLPAAEDGPSLPRVNPNPELGLRCPTETADVASEHQVGRSLRHPLWAATGSWRAQSMLVTIALATKTTRKVWAPTWGGWAAGTVGIGLSIVPTRCSTSCCASPTTWRRSQTFSLARSATGVTPDQVTTDGRGSYSRAICSCSAGMVSTAPATTKQQIGTRLPWRETSRSR
jgi:hypothetical protein